MIILLANLQNITIKVNNIHLSYMNKNEGFTIEKLCKTKKQFCFVLTKVFSFLSLIFASTQALIYYCVSFLDFLANVIHFCKYIFTDLMETYFTFLHTFSFVMPYWHALEKTWPKQVPWKLSYELKISQLTTNFNALPYLKFMCMAFSTKIYTFWKK